MVVLVVLVGVISWKCESDLQGSKDSRCSGVRPY